MIKTITHPETGKTFRLGRNRPVARCPRLSLHRYLTAGALPVPPATGHYSRAAEGVLANPFLNTSLGDCVIAGPSHLVGLFTGNAGLTPVEFTDAQIVSLYSAIGGYDPSKTDAQGNNPTDNGCDEQTMLNYWQQHGLCGHEIVGWIAVKPEQAKLAMWLFEGLVFGVELPDAWTAGMPSQNGYVWDVAGDPDPSSGHCFVGVGWNDNGIIIDSWGLIGTITYAAVEKYASTAGQGELYAVVTKEALNSATQKAASGVDWSQLVADFDALGGKLVAA